LIPQNEEEVLDLVEKLAALIPIHCIHAFLWFSPPNYCPPFAAISDGVPDWKVIDTLSAPG